MRIEELVQKRSWSCGPAALKILLAEFGHQASEEQLIQLTGATPQAGATHEGMIRAAESLGYRVHSKDDFSESELATLLDSGTPVLVDFQGDNGGHYAVAQSLKGTRVILIDPRTTGDTIHSIHWEAFIANWYSRRYSDKEIVSKWGMILEPKVDNG